MRSRWIGPAAVLLLLLPIAWVLGSRVEDTYEEPLTREHRDRLAVPIELSYADYPLAGGTHTARTILYLDNLDTLLRRDAIEIRVATFGTTPRLDAAEIAIPGTPCVYAATPGAEYRNNAILLFERGEGCAAAEASSEAGQLHLTVRYRDAARVGVWTFRHEGTPRDAHTIYVRDPAWSEIGLVVELRGRWIERRGPSGYTRADLLGIMWEIAPGSGWIWGVMAVAAVLLLAGAAGLQTPAAGASLGAASAFLLAMGLTLLYVVLVPPFQAPDEPSHFGGYALLTGQPEVHDAANQWGYRMHFMRVHSHSYDRFRPADIGNPDIVPSNVAPLGLDRSSVTVPFWRAASRWLAPLGVPQQLLVLRLINGVFFSLALAASVLLFAWLAPVPRPRSLIAILLLVPTLPFFAMHVSNYAPVVAAYLVFATAALVTILAGPRAHWAGLLLGLSTAFAILCTRSAVPMVALTAALALVRLIAPPGAAANGALRRGAIFWSGLMAGLVLLGEAATEQYAGRMLIDAEVASPRLAAASAWILAYPALFGVVAAAAMTAVEVAATWAQRVWGGRARAIVGRLVRPVCLAVIVMIGANVLASLVATLPHLRTSANPDGHASAGYLGRAVATLLTPFRLRDHDFEASVTFWGAFGWVNAILPGWILSVLVGGTALAAIVTLRELRRRGSAGAFARTLTASVGVVATLVGYAAAGLWTFTPVVLHGRYLIGVYLVALVIAWSPILYGQAEQPRHDWLRRFCWVMMGLAHTIAMAIILRRYF